VKSLHWMPEVSTLIANTENLHIDEDGCGRNYQYSQQDVHRKVRHHHHFALLFTALYCLLSDVLVWMFRYVIALVTVNRR
jgi:hypothetical protein